MPDQVVRVTNGSSLVVRTGSILGVGPSGPIGPQGPPGPTGIQGTIWFTGPTAPTSASNPAPRTGDLWIDPASGNISTYSSATGNWTAGNTNIKAARHPGDHRPDRAHRPAGRARCCRQRVPDLQRHPAARSAARLSSDAVDQSRHHLGSHQPQRLRAASPAQAALLGSGGGSHGSVRRSRGRSPAGPARPDERDDHRVGGRRYPRRWIGRSAAGQADHDRLRRRLGHPHRHQSEHLDRRGRERSRQRERRQARPVHPGADLQ